MSSKAMYVHMFNLIAASELTFFSFQDLINTTYAKLKTQLKIHLFLYAWSKCREKNRINVND